MERIAITGATGFVGRALCHHLERRVPSVAILALGRKEMAITPSLKSTCADLLLNEDGVLATIEAFRPQVIIQLAALTLYAPPEDQFSQYINTEVPKRISQLALKIGALDVFTSTDLVFDGTNPPYKPDSEPNPLTIYGETKRKAEEWLLKDSNSLVVRIPQLIGLHGTFFAAIQANLAQGKEMDLFSDEYRSILCVDDAVRLLVALIDKAVKKELDLSVPWHVGGPDSISRYEIGEEVVRIRGLSPQLIKPISASSVSKVPRPKDTTLDSTRTYEAAGFRPRRAREAIVFALEDRY